MEMCQPHWDKMREAVKSRGMWPLVARNGEEAMELLKRQVSGAASAGEYDPLIAMFWMVSNRVTEDLGFYIMAELVCPICEAMRVHPKPCPNGCTDEDIERYFVEGPADAALAYINETPELKAMLQVL